MDFKEMIRNDIRKTVLDVSFFSDTHLVGGKPMSVVIDNNRLDKMKSENPYNENISLANKLIYVAAEDFGECPAIGAFLELDNKTHRVSAVKDGVLYEIALEEIV